jgi:tetratricopeptide (TPR) repeat protein
MEGRVTPSAADWFRSNAWDAAARELFETKLNRTRSSRAQYLRIKGLALIDVSDPERVEAGRQLLRRVIEEHADDALQVAGAHYALGDSFAREGRYDEAAEHLHACLALEASRSFSHRTELRLAETLIENHATESYDEACELLNVSAQQRMLFNGVAWRIEVARARLLVGEGQEARAAAHARNALALLEHNDHQLPRHPDVGQIHADPCTLREMKRLAKR